MARKGHAKVIYKGTFISIQTLFQPQASKESNLIAKVPYLNNQMTNIIFPAHLRLDILLQWSCKKARKCIYENSNAIS